MYGVPPQWRVAPEATAEEMRSVRVGKREGEMRGPMSISVEEEREEPRRRFWMREVRRGRMRE